MKFKARILPDLMEDMMRYVRLDLTDKFNSSQKPYFNHDTMQKFINEMLEKDSNSVDKFPVVYMRPDYIEDYNTGDSRVLYNATIELYIIHRTEPIYKVGNRYEEVFKPILYPIFEALMYRLKHYAGFTFNYEHSKQDLLQWGLNNENFVNEYIDAIHLTNMTLGVMKTNC